MQLRAHNCIHHELHHALRCNFSSGFNHWTPYHAHSLVATPCSSPGPPSLRCHLAALAFVLYLEYRVIHNQSQRIGILTSGPPVLWGQQNIYNKQPSLKHIFLANLLYSVTDKQIFWWWSGLALLLGLEWTRQCSDWRAWKESNHIWLPLPRCNTDGTHSGSLQDACSRLYSSLCTWHGDKLSWQTLPIRSTTILRMFVFALFCMDL